MKCGSDCFVHTTCSRCGAWLIHRDVFWARPLELIAPPYAERGWERFAAPIGFIAAVTGFIGAAMVQPFDHLTVLAAYLAAFAGMALGSSATVVISRWVEGCRRERGNRAVCRRFAHLPLTSASGASDGVVHLRGRVRPTEPGVSAGAELASVRADAQWSAPFQLVDASGASVLVERGLVELWLGTRRGSEAKRAMRLCEGDLVEVFAVGRWQLGPAPNAAYRSERPVFRLIGRPGTPVHLRFADAASLRREKAAA